MTTTDFLRRAGQRLADRGPTVRVGSIDILSLDGRHVLWPDSAQDVSDPAIRIIDGTLDDAVEAARAHEADAIADQAIARSISHTEIVTLDDAPGLRDALLVRCDDNVDSQDGDGDSVAEYWGTDVAGSSWRVHVRRKA